MGNRWGILTQENTGTFGNHTMYTTPALELDVINWDPDLDMGNKLEFTTGYDMKRMHWLEALSGRVKVENYLAGDNVGEFIKSVLGTYSVNVAGDPYFIHTFKPDQAGTAWTWQGYDSDFTNYRKQQGIQATSLEILARARGVASMNWEGIVATELTAAVAPTTMGTLPSVRPFVFYDGSVSIEAAQARAESFRVRIEPQIPEDTHTLGNRSRQYLVKEGTVITAEAEMSVVDYNNLKRYYGDSASSTPQDEDELVACSFILDGPPTGGATVYDQYKLTVTLPECVITGHKAIIDRRGRRMERVQLEALYNAGNLIELINKKATYVAA